MGTPTLQRPASAGLCFFRNICALPADFGIAEFGRCRSHCANSGTGRAAKAPASRTAPRALNDRSSAARPGSRTGLHGLDRTVRMALRHLSPADTATRRRDPDVATGRNSAPKARAGAHRLACSVRAGRRRRAWRAWPACVKRRHPRPCGPQAYWQRQPGGLIRARPRGSAPAGPKRRERVRRRSHADCAGAPRKGRRGIRVGRAHPHRHGQCRRWMLRRAHSLSHPMSRRRVQATVPSLSAGRREGPRSRPILSRA